MSGIVQTQKVNGHLAAVFPQTMIPHRGVECSSATVGSSCLHFPRLLISLILFPPSTPSFSSPIFGLCLLSVVHNSALSSCPLFASFNLLLSSIQRKFRLIFVLSQLSVLNPRHQNLSKILSQKLVEFDEKFVTVFIKKYFYILLFGHQLQYTAVTCQSCNFVLKIMSFRLLVPGGSPLPARPYDYKNHS